MDHVELLDPSRPAVKRIEVPFVCKDNCCEDDSQNLKSFKDYCESRNDDQIEHSNAEELAALMQSWLYFGLLDEALDLSSSWKQFIKNTGVEERIYVLSSASLPRLIDERIESLLQLPADRRKSALSHIHRCLEIAISEVDRLDQLCVLYDSHLLQTVQLSVKVLICSLNSIIVVLLGLNKRQTELIGKLSCGLIPTVRQSLKSIRSFSRERAEQDGLSGSELNSFKRFQAWWLSSPESCPPLSRNRLLPAPEGCRKESSATLLLRRQLTENGWCTSQVTKLFQSFDYAAVYYFSTIPHTTKVLDHSNCSQTRCLAYNMRPAAFKFRHADGCQGCKMVFAPISEIISIIEDGGIPLISIEQGAGDSISVDVHRCNPGWTPYAAVSHVWSDGLGNPYANGLPACQLRKLSISLQRLPGSDEKLTLPDIWIQRSWKKSSRRLFWMDTLCIPNRSRTAKEDNASPDIESGLAPFNGAGTYDGNRPETNQFQSPDLDIESLKRKAINRMGLVYAAASATLVLDAELQRSCSVNSSNIYNLARVLFSPWSTRGWTLQEGGLAESCSFQLSDGICNVSKIRFPREWQASSTHIEDPRNPKKDIFAQGIFAQMLAGVRETVLWQKGRNEERDKMLSEDMFRQPLVEKFYYAHILVRAWNSMLQRSTTQKADVDAVVANILDLSAQKILELPSQHRVRAMISKLYYIPLSLLYVDAPRLTDPTKECLQDRNRWFPSEIEGDKLTDGPILERQPGRFHLVRFYPSPPIFYDLADSPSLPQTFYWKASDRNQLYVIRVPAISSAELPSRSTDLGSVSRCLLVDREGFQNLRHGFAAKGASMVVSRKHSKAVQTIFEFPIRITLQDDPVNEGLAHELSVVTGQLSPNVGYFVDLFVEYGTSATRRRVQQGKGTGMAPNQPLVRFVLCLCPFLLGAGIFVCSYNALPTAARAAVGGYLIFLSVAVSFGLTVVPIIEYQKWTRSFGEI
ncbi:hypothetical protein EV356DRAFT_520234 [Viridothelium virens]|uniref:Heterokaryon incompatibility domain-containing protein n=1 Tax=Viridothelium virens TaxID=1048519 RepID=A0A6A6GW46_VIRVR|nr:hypothetical protein EV356DRAFT_520234 [Viridothelium virens]